MSSGTTLTTATGGFIGDPAAAFTPPAMSGCCGSAPVQVAEAESGAAGLCCGTVAETATPVGCCGATARPQTVASGARCCG